MSDLHPTSSDIRCEQSFSSNSTTSPVSPAEAYDPRTWRHRDKYDSD